MLVLVKVAKRLPIITKPYSSYKGTHAIVNGDNNIVKVSIYTVLYIFLYFYYIVHNIFNLFESILLCHKLLCHKLLYLDEKLRNLLILIHRLVTIILPLLKIEITAAIFMMMIAATLPFINSLRPNNTKEKISFNLLLNNTYLSCDVFLLFYYMTAINVLYIYISTRSSLQCNISYYYLTLNNGLCIIHLINVFCAVYIQIVFEINK